MSEVTNRFYVYLNSANREVGGNNSDFLYKINFPGNGEYTHFVVLDADIPVSWYMFRDGLNSFSLVELGVSVTITVPVGNYSYTSLKGVLNTLLTNASPHSWTYSVSVPNTATASSTGLYTFTVSNNSGQPSFVFGNACFEQLGFDKNSTNVFSSNVLVSTNVVKLIAEDRVVIHSNAVQSYGQDDILLTINGSYPPFSVINYVCPAPEYTAKRLFTSKDNLYSFSLTDENGDILDTGGLSWNATLMFYRKDPIFDNCRQFFKFMINSMQENRAE